MNDVFELWNVIWLTNFSLQDLKNRELSFKKLKLFVFCSLILFLMEGLFEGKLTVDFSGRLATGMIPGVFMLLLAGITNDAVGEGDGWIILGVGILEGFIETLSWILTASCLAALYAMVAMLTKSKQYKSQFAFIPFLLFSYLIQIVAERLY